MDKQLKGMRTEQNLWAAFNGESAARVKYQLYAMRARMDGLHQVASVFDETADNELQHARLWLRALGEFGQTADNLQKAQAGEHYEWTTMYTEFERVAREEGFNDLAEQFHRAAEVEQRHDNRYGFFMKQLTEQTLFRKDAPQNWKCRLCGYCHTGDAAPEACPLCKYPQGWFEVVPQQPGQ